MGAWSSFVFVIRETGCDKNPGTFIDVNLSPNGEGGRGKPYL